MSIDASIISYVTGNDALSEMQRAGVSASDFVDEYQTIWKYLTRAKRDHDTTPSPDVLQTRFPDIELPRVKRRDIPLLLRDLRQRRKYIDTLTALNEAASAATSYDSVDDVITNLMGSLNELTVRQNGGRDHIVDLFSEDVRKEFLKEMKRRRSGKTAGIPTGLQRFDRMAGGLQKQKMVVIIGRPGLGKASACYEPVLTPQGWVPMGDISTGDVVVTPDAGEAKVLSVHPQGAVPIYRVTMSDGSHTDVTEDHLWLTSKRWERKAGRSAVRTTREISRTLHLKHYVPVVEPYEWPDSNQPLDPYVLGALLGDGCLTRSYVTFTCFDEEIVEEISNNLPAGDEIWLTSKEGAWTIGHKKKRAGSSATAQAIMDLGLRGSKSATKFVPEVYLYSSSETRLAVLQGLMDTDGYAANQGCTYATTSEQLADDVAFLVQSLGGTAKKSYKITKCGEARGEGWVLTIKMPRGMCPFRLARKAERWSGQQFDPWRRIVSVEPVGEHKAQCITIDHPEHLYITRDFIVTHNSWLDLLFVANAVISGHKCMLYPLEMTLFETAARLYTLFSNQMFGQDKVLKNYALSTGKLNPRKVYKFMMAMEDKFQGQLYVADVGSLSDPYTNERVEAEVEMHKPDMFWIDYLTLMKAPGTAGVDDWGAVRQLSNGVKNTAMRRNVVGGCSAQVNRSAMSENVFLPRLEHIAYGDSIGQDADQVISINRKGSNLFYALVKNRGGPEIGKTRVRFMPDIGRLDEIPEEGEEDAESA